MLFVSFWTRKCKDDQVSFSAAARRQRIFHTTVEMHTAAADFTAHFPKLSAVDRPRRSVSTGTSLALRIGMEVD